MNTYDPADLRKKKKKKVKKEKTQSSGLVGLVVFLSIVAVILGYCVVVSIDPNISLPTGKPKEEETPVTYVGVLEVHGTMSSDGDELSSEYNQKWLLEQIDTMMHDPNNKGLILSIDTPGGSVYTVDELYLKIKEYQTTTMRPVYSYMESMAASGGYYISAPADKIYANRNCWTGSIGVTIGTVYDITELLENLGIKTVTITAGSNKAMGSATEKLTDEQKAIYQSLVDEAYNQFVDIVAEGRKMDRNAVVKLADGRIYTAKQAFTNGLIDAIGTREEAIAAMKTDYAMFDCTTKYYTYEQEFSLSNFLFGLSKELGKDAKSEYNEIMELSENYGTFSISYMANERN